MISVDNFYWVLWQQLLQPCGISCWYHYPWGTQDNIIQSEYTTFNSLADVHHVVFGYDQEPIWTESMSALYDNQGTTPWTVRYIKILANSEKSQVKRNLCKSRSFLDWYFFYHGFAALDWYRDGRTITHQHNIVNAYLSFNHIVHDRRNYRIALIARLLDRDCIHTGKVSLHANVDTISAELSKPYSNLSIRSQDLIKRNLHKMSTLPWTLDQVPVNGDLSARFGFHEHKLWQSAFLHVVNETVFYEPKLHLTEKIFKPIVAARPFLLVAAPGNLAYLRSYGFQTFDKWIDESYDQIQDADARLDAIASEIYRLQRLPLQALRRLLEEMTPVLRHNREHFYGNFRKIIVDEMTENFQQCLRIWNNGRVDDHGRPLHPDLDQVKQLLLS